jgi:transposase
LKLQIHLVCSFLERWVTLEAVQKESPEILLQFFRSNGSRSKKKNEERLSSMAQAVPLVTDRAILDSSVMMVQALVVQMRALLQSISHFEKEIDVLMTRHPDGEIFTSFPGAGENFAPRMLAAFGSQRERFASADEAARFFGIAPLIERSGKQCWVRWRYFCPKFLRQSFHEFTAQSIRLSS